MAFNADKYLEVNNQSSVGTPAAGSLRVYSKTDKSLYIKDDTGLETMISGGGGSIDIINRNSDNIMLNAFRIAVNGDISYLHMVDGVMDEYADETGIDVPGSTSATYMSRYNYYTNIDANTKLLLHFDGAENAIHHMWGNSDLQMGLTTSQFVYGAKSSSNLSADTVAWEGFSDNKYDTTNQWNSQEWESAPYLQYEFYEPKVIKSYCVASNDAASNLEDPASWVFQASNNGVDWKDLHTVHGETFDPKSSTNVEMALNMSVSKYYNTDNRGAYKFYRIKVTDRYGALGAPAGASPDTVPTGTSVKIQEFQMFEDLNNFSHDSSSSQHGLYPIRDAAAVVRKAFGETDAYKANSALFFTQDGYSRTYFKWLTQHQNDIRIIPELRQGNNANVDTVGGNTTIYGGTNWRPAGRVSAGMWHGSYEPWHLFMRRNQAATDAWYCNDTAGWPAWIMWEGTEESTCTNYSLAASSVTIDGTPRSWSLKGNTGNEIPELGMNYSMVPRMTSNVLPFPYEASASSQNTGTYAAWTAFNGSKTGTVGWITPIMASPSGWVQIKLDEERVVNRYSITAPSASEADRSPTDWTFLGSNAPAASGWTVLDTVTNCDSWWDNEEREFFITPSVPYQYYRWDMTANDGDPQYLGVQEFEIGHTEVEVKNNISGDAYEAWTMNNCITYGTYGCEFSRPGWISITLPQSKTITAYDMTAPYIGITNSPAAWTLYGNNNDQAINTKFLADFEGSDGATTYTSNDLWGRVATFTGSAQIDTAQFKFGSSSLLLNGTTDYVTFATLGLQQTSYDFSGENFTVDAWIRFSSVTTGNTLQSIVGNYLDGNNIWGLYWDETGTALTFIHKINSVNRVVVSETWSPSINTWYHVAVIRGWSGNPNDYALTVDGTILGTATTDSSYLGVLRGSTLYIGGLAAAYYFAGHIDQPRITKGQALWTANFTAPSSAYTVTLTSLDSQSDQVSWRANERRNYEFTNSSPYRFYKLDVSATEAESTYIYIQELELFETGWTLLDAQENTEKWIAEEVRIYPVPSGNRAPYKSYRLDISDPYNPANIMNLGELTLFSEDPGSAQESIGDFEPGWGDFTMEGWYMWLQAGHAKGAVGLFDTGSDGTSTGVYVYHDGTNSLYTYSNDANGFYRHWRPTAGKWHHIALVRENGVTRLFADGKKLGDDDEWNGYIRGQHYDGKLGSYNDITSPFDGYIKEVRYSDIARYYEGVDASGTTFFTPQTTPFVADANTKLLVHGYQENTDMQDYCAYFNNDYDFIGIPYSDAFRFEMIDFTIETHFKMVQTGTHVLYASGGPVATTGSLRVYVEHNSQCIVNLAEGDYPFNYQFIQGTWYHVAVVRTNNRLRCYVNGVEIGSDAQKGVDVSQAGSLNSTTSVQGDYVRIGSDFNANYFWGYMKNFRVSNIARYTEDFFPPTAEYANDANTVLLLPMKDPDSLIPAMGGYWMPDATHVHASTENSNVYRAWKALNYERRLDASSWITDGASPSGWLEFELENAVTASGYTVGGFSGTTQQPKDWTLYGTNTRPYNQVSLQNYHMCCVPRMQKNVCPGNAAAEWPDTMVHYKYECSASSEFNSTTNQAFNAFEYEGDAEWRSDNNDVNGAWLMFDFTEDDKRIITQYGMRCGVVANTPTSWIFQASNDLVTWIDLDDRNLLEDRVDYPSVWVVNDRKYWEVTNSTAYRYYRIYVREVSTLASVYVTIRDLFLYDGSRGTSQHSNGIAIDGYYAFNGVLQDGYGWRGDIAAGGNAWLQYDFAPASSKTVVRYDICASYSDAVNTSPKDWTFEGSNSDMLDYAPILNQFDTIALGRYRGAAKATASTTYSDWWPYNAFNHQYDLDGGTGGGWSSNTTTNSWLRIDLDVPFAVQAYTIVAQLGTLTTLPKDWTFEGSTAAEALTTMLLHCEGSDTSTTVPDTSLSPYVLTCVGNAQIDTAQFKFGTSSLLLDGTGDYVTIPLNLNHDWSDDLNFEGEDFCFEGWFRFNVTPDDFALWGSSLVGSHFDIFNATSIRIYDSWTPSDFIEFTTSTMTTATWYHIAIARDGDNLRVFLDGVQQDTTKDCAGHAYNHNNTGTHQLGAYNALHFFNGWMDEIRISKGTARYTSNFTPEVSAWTDPAWTVLDTVTGETAWRVHERRKFDFVNAVAYDTYRLNISVNDGGATYTRLQELELHVEGETWDVLDTVTGETVWKDDERKTFELSNSTPYTSYRLNITANNGATSTIVQELSLYEEQNWVTLDTVSGETGWVAWENRYFDIASPGSYKYYKLDVTDNNGAATLAMSYFQFIPDTHLATDYSSYSHSTWISGEVDRRYHDHWLTNIVKDDSRATEDETHLMYHVGTGKTVRTNVTGNGSFYAWGTGDRIEMPYSDDLNFYARDDDKGFDYGSILSPNSSRTDSDFTIAWWSNWQSNANATFIDIFRYQEGIRNAFVSDTWSSYYDAVNHDYNYRPALHTWQHYACVRKDDTLYQFVDGHLVATWDCSDLNMSDVVSTYSLIIAWDNAGSYYHLGQMDEIQIIKGEAKWTSDFTPPTVETSIVSPSMTLKSQSFDADAVPAEARLTVFAEPVDTFAINTNLLGYVSRDDGTTWTQVTLVDQGVFDSSGKHIYSASADISGQPSGTAMKYRYSVVTSEVRIHGTGLSWTE